MTQSFRPIAGAHAIENCIIIVRFVQAVDPGTMSAIGQEASRIAKDNDLPAAQQMVIPQMIFGAVGMNAMSPSMGSVYQRYAPNGQVEAELRCEPQAITLTVRKYAGWNDLLSFVDRTVLVLLPLYISSLPAISAVSLQYDDRFLGVENADALAAGELFKAGTPWVTIYDPKTTQPWHSHFGIFLPKGEDRRELINVNVTVNDQFDVDGSLRRAVGLTLLVTEAFDIPGQSPLIVEPNDATNIVRSLFGDAHSRMKAILNDVLDDTYLEAIGAKVS